MTDGPTSFTGNGHSSITTGSGATPGCGAPSETSASPAGDPGRFQGIWISKKALAVGGLLMLLVVALSGSYYLYKRLAFNEPQPLPAGPRLNGHVATTDSLFYRYSRLMLIDNYKNPSIRRPAKDGVFDCLRDGSAWAEKKEFDKAIVKYDQAIRLDPDNHWAFWKRGCAWMANHEYDKAIKDFDEAILLEPDRDKTHFYYVFRANCYSGKRDYEKAIKEFDDVIRLSPKKPGEQALFYRGHAWAAKKEYDKAISDFNELLERPIGRDERELPPVWFPYIERGMAWSAKKDHGKALKDFEKAIKSLDEWIRFLRDDPPDALNPGERVLLDHMLVCCHDDLAWLLATCGEDRIRDGNRAVQLAKRACELTHWNKGWELSTLAAAYAEAGNFEDAERQQTKALEDQALRGSDVGEFRRRVEFYKQKKKYRQNP